LSRELLGRRARAGHRPGARRWRRDEIDVGHDPAHDGRNEMIRVHQGRDGERPVWVNAELIETVEATPDTVVTLLTQRKLIVRETPDELLALVVEYRRKIAARPHVLAGG
jgi:flagellar protein FlbD